MVHTSICQFKMFTTKQFLMKTILFLVALFCQYLAHAQMPTGYCVTKSYPNIFINNVTIGNINNTSTYGPQLDGYTDYTSLSTGLSPTSAGIPLSVSYSNPYN